MVKNNEVLKSVEKKISLTNKESFDPKVYFQDREGLWVGSSFEERIREKASKVEAGKEYEIASFVLAEYATDEAIEAALPKEHIFTESDVAAIIATMIDKQPKGEEGDLLNTGDWNLFYTPAFVVSVGWSGDEWHVNSWGRVDISWHADDRVFSPAN